MSNLQTMTEKILENAKLESEKILSDAKAENQRLISEKTAEAKELKDMMVSKASKEAPLISERLVASQQLKARDAILKAKQEVIDKVFKSAKEKILDLDDNKFTEYLKNTVNGLELKGNEQLVVPEKYKKAVEALGLPVKLASDKSTNTGFMINTDSTVMNYSFDELIDFNREKLENEIAANLFGE